jgi:putative oxidoreductase
MSVIHKIEQWGDHHHPAMLDILRIILGIFLVLKGYEFMQNSADLNSMLDDQQVIPLSQWVITIVINYVVFIHMTGGLLIMLGLLTRLSSLLQLPVVIGAIFMVDLFKSPFNNDFWLTIFTAVLLLVFMFIGSGPLSLDSYLSSFSKEQ